MSIKVRLCVKVGDVNVFFGEYQHNLDAKGRLTMPAEFRESFNNIVYVTKGFEGCLNVYTEEEFMKILGRINQLNDSNQAVRKYSRIFSKYSKKLELDKMGRMNLPSNLINEANLSKTCIVLGSFNHLEIWDEEIWRQYCEESEDSYEEMAESAFKGE